MASDQDEPLATAMNTESVDSQIDSTTSINYWSSVDSTVDGMLGGYPQVSRVDLQGSRSFLNKLRRLDRVAQQTSTTTSPSDASSSTEKDKSGTKHYVRALEGGAGIGRITKGLLLDLAQQIDIVEPVAKFAEALRTDDVIEASEQLRDVNICGLESWNPPAGRTYDIIWNQWCVGHLTDVQLVEYLKRCAGALSTADATRISGDGSTGNGEQNDAQRSVTGWIIVKENLSTPPEFPVDSQQDVFDEEDSSVTRSDVSFRRVFKEAGLKVVRFEVQKGMPKVLYSVGMYALRPQ